MAAKMTIQTRTQLPVYTAETLAAKNPVLLKGEVVYESDTRKHKVGDGTTAWNSLPYAGGRRYARHDSGGERRAGCLAPFRDRYGKRPMECGVTFCSESDMEGQ